MFSSLEFSTLSLHENVSIYIFLDLFSLCIGLIFYLFMHIFLLKQDDSESLLEKRLRHHAPRFSSVSALATQRCHDLALHRTRLERHVIRIQTHLIHSRSCWIQQHVLPDVCGLQF